MNDMSPRGTNRAKAAKRPQILEESITALHHLRHSWAFFDCFKNVLPLCCKVTNTLGFHWPFMASKTHLLAIYSPTTASVQHSRWTTPGIWPWIPVNSAPSRPRGLACYICFKSSNAELAITPAYHWGVVLGNRVRERRRGSAVPYVGEKHVLIKAVFLLFQLCSPTLDEEREQGSSLDRRGRWGFIEELGITRSGQSPNQLFSIRWESKLWDVAGLG